MNVKYIEGNIPMPLRIIEKVFEKSYDYFVAGLRMYFVLIPMFAWLISSWTLLGITIPHLFLVYSYDNLGWLESEVDEMYSTYQPLLSTEEKQVEILASNQQPHTQHQKQQQQLKQVQKSDAIFDIEKGNNNQGDLK